MSVRVTDGFSAALYDSVSGQAFGPVFNGEAEAHDFLDWLNERATEGLRFQHGNEELLYLDDPRTYRADELQHIYQLFLADEGK